jgi:predicted RNA-binding Zn ribbon-like protein
MWLADAGILDRAPAVDQADLESARELRAALYAYVQSLTEGHPAPAHAVSVINSCAAQAPPVIQLDRAGRPVSSGDVSAALSALARSGIGLAAGDRRELIRWCAGPLCTRAFLDLSRGRRRVWCSMAGCGDRAKAKAYRDRAENRREHAVAGASSRDEPNEAGSGPTG